MPVEKEAVTMFGKKKKDAPDLTRVCEFCENASLINDERYVLCSLHGIVCREYRCKKYNYDPLKRGPRSLPPLPTLSEEDVLL